MMPDLHPRGQRARLGLPITPERNVSHWTWCRREAGLSLYSAPRPDGFFFEIVQRQGNYQGYGAPNAPFRIAAQKRAARPSGMPKR